jgi:uncharacterized membrane protein YkoI
MAGRQIAFSKCPKEVRATVLANDRGGMIEETEVHKVGGRKVYVVDINLSPTREIEVFVFGSGKLMKIREDIPLRSAPSAVRRVAAAFTGRIDDVDKETSSNGDVTYEIEIDRPGKPDLKLLIAPDGRILDRSTGDDPYDFRITALAPAGSFMIG